MSIMVRIYGGRHLASVQRLCYIRNWLIALLTYYLTLHFYIDSGKID